MTRLTREQEQKQILQLILSERFDYFFFEYNHECCCASMSENNVAIGFRLSALLPYIYRRLGYRPRRDRIKHALAPLKKNDYYYIIYK